ncbi:MULTISPECIES: FkbM family methyltransferase [Mesoflavibacter]|uniref:FkbM family methyltransferase n=1 Tax=Mesoflavibacter TaxID=444051 RepID=UPI0026ECF783|nr:FkbM family methyltransferase [Mesoflavibacter zeaxanthinifaciens]
MLKQLKIIKTLKGNFSLFESIKIYFALKNQKEKVYLSKRKQNIFFRKDTKDYETFEEIFISKIYNLELTFKPITIIDAGANTGFASLFFKFKYPLSEIVALEIDKGNLKMINKNLNNHKRIEIINKGLYNKSSFFKVENPYNATNSFVIKEVNKNESFDIESITIDKILEHKKWNTIDILKIDIEGAEKELFEKNYENWLPKVKVIFIETHDRMKRNCAYTVFRTIYKYQQFILYTTTEGTLIFYNTDLVRLP